MLDPADPGTAAAGQNQAEGLDELSELSSRGGRDFNAAILETVAALVVVMDRDGRIVLFNRACEAATGYTSDGMLGTVLWEGPLLGSDREEIRASFAELADGASFSQKENIWVAKDGTHRLISWSNTTVLDPDGQVALVIGTGLDITEKKRTEAALRESERRLTTAQRQAKIGYWQWALGDEGMTYVSEHYREILGLTEDQTPRRQEDFNRMIHPADHDRVAAYFLEVSSEPRDYEVDYWILRPDGAVRHVVEIGEVTYDAKGRPTGHTGTLQDITTLKSAEEALRVSDARLRAIIDNSPADIHLNDAEGRYLLVNRQFEKWYGAGSEEVRGKLPHDFFSADYADAYLTHHRAVVETGQAIEMEDQAPLQDGIHTMLTTRFPIPGDAPGETIVGTISTDITDRKRAEDAMRESKGRFKSVVNNSPSAILLKDREGRYQLVNKRFEEWYGLSGEQALGRTSFDVFPAQFAERYVAQDQAVLDSGETISYERQVPFADGTLRDIIVTKFPVHDSAGELSGVGSVNTDITELKARESSLIAAKQEAELANRAKSEFLANMSHELRTPLNAVIGFAELIEKEAFGPIENGRYCDHAKEIVTAGRELLGLINDVLDLAKIEAGKLEPNETEVDPSTAIGASLVLASGRARQGGLTLEQDIDEGLPRIWADARMLKQMLNSLLSNAIKFTPSGGKVRVSARIQEDRGYLIEITDTGMGMSLDDIPRAMVRFGQVNGALTRKFGGSGLGLPLAKSLIELHGGSLDLESAVGAGTKVTLRFPAERILTAKRPRAAGT